MSNRNKNEPQGHPRRHPYPDKIVKEAEGIALATFDEGSDTSIASSLYPDRLGDQSPEMNDQSKTGAIASQAHCSRFPRTLPLDDMIFADDDEWPPNGTNSPRRDPPSEQAPVTNNFVASNQDLRLLPVLHSGEKTLLENNRGTLSSDEESQSHLSTSFQHDPSSDKAPDFTHDQRSHDPPAHSLIDVSSSRIAVSFHPLSFKDQARGPPDGWLYQDAADHPLSFKDQARGPPDGWLYQDAAVRKDKPEGLPVPTFEDKAVRPSTEASLARADRNRRFSASGQPANYLNRSSHCFDSSSRHPVVSAVEVTETIGSPRLSSLGRTGRTSRFSSAVVLEQKSALKRLCLILVAATVMLTLIVAGIIGAIFAARSGNSSGDTELQPTPNPSEVPTIAPSSLRPTTGPTTSPSMIQSTAPFIDGPASSRLAFLSTEELYRAVDLYVVNKNLTLEYGDSIGDWDVSRIQNFNRVFDANRNDTSLCFGTVDCRSFNINEDLSGWDTSRATTMFAMFMHANDFNGNITTWDTSGVWDMSFMFRSATAFNQDISSWDVRSAGTMEAMFAFAPNFNQDVSNWEVGTNLRSMRSTFNRASSFNQDLSGWNVGGVRDMAFLFFEAEQFNQDISDWNTSNVEQMESMFHTATAFDQNISAWDVSSVRNMEFTFSLARSFNQDVSGWNVSSVRNVRFMFAGASAFNQSLCTWGPQLQRETMVEGMFGANSNFGPSGCAVVSDPVIPFGPFCHTCIR